MLEDDFDRIEIGRDPDAAVTFDDPSVSRHHAAVIHDDGDYVIEDLGSSNGTFVDGVPVVSCVLRDGDTVQIGNNLFYFERILLPDTDA